MESEIRVYEPRGAALQLGRTRAPEVLIEGPAGTGKTRAVLEYVVALCEQKPGMRALLVRQTRKSMSESVLVTLEQRVLGEGHPAIHGTATRAHRDGYVFPNGSEMVLGGLDNPDRIMSTEYDVVAFFEATEGTQDAWEKLTTRARNNVLPWQQCIADCNPGAAGHWLNKRARSGRMVRLLSRHEDNPSVTEAYLENLRNLTGARRKRLYEGRWVSAEGMVWETWDADVHLVGEPTEEQLSRMVFWGAMDFGYRDAQVFQAWGMDREGVCWRVAEVYWTQKGLEWWADTISRLNKRYRFRTIVADPSRPDTIDFLNSRLTPLGGRNDGQLVEKADNRRASKGVGDLGGLDVVRWMLKDEKGASRVKVVRDAFPEGKDESLVERRKPTCLEEEVPDYVWAEAEDGKPLKDVPAEGNEHACDAFRYAMSWAYQRVLELNEKREEYAPNSCAKLLGWEKVMARGERWVHGYGYDEPEKDGGQCWI